MQFERVLVPIDFSDDSLSALQVAQRFASPTATLVLVHAVDTDQSFSEHAGLREQVLQAQAHDMQPQLQTLAGSHRADWLEVRTVLERGKPSEVILSAARDAQADLVIMGSHGKTSLTRTLFGGTTYHVARKLNCSVMVLRAGKHA